MRFFNFILFICGFTCYACYAQDCKARIVLSSDIENVNYVIDEKKIGKGSQIEIELAEGTYILSAIQSGNAWNPLYFKDTLRIRDCGEYKTSFSFKSFIHLKSEPDDAYVFRNDSLIGNTPLVFNSFGGEIVIKKPGYHELKVAENNLNSIVKLEASRESNGRRFYEKSLFKYLLGGIVALGATTAYFKIMADERFSEYELNGNENLLKETRRYDLISGITFGALQINFGFLLYYFLSE
jgi:hypothetical protein